MREYTYENGFAMVYEKSIATTGLTTILLGVKVGSVDEQDGIRGVSHFVEHMCFKGCGKYGTSAKIYKYFDGMGVYFNAYTEKDHTVYVIKCDDKYASKCLDALAELLLDTRMDKKEYEKERRVVYEENLKNVNDYSGILFDKMDEIIFNGTPYQYAIDCIDYHDKREISQYSLEDAVKYYEKFYVANNMVLSICTGQTWQHVQQMVQGTRFAREEAKPVIERVSAIQYQRVKKYTNIVNPDTSVAYLCITYPICGMDDTDIYVLEMIDAICSGYSSSIMFSELREEKGLTYSASTTMTTFKSMGSFTFYAETDEAKLLRREKGEEGVYPTMEKIIRRLRQEGVTKEEFDMAHRYLKANEVVSVQTDYPVATNNLETYLYGLPHVPTVKYYDTVYKDITQEQVNNICKKYFREERKYVGLLSSKKIRLFESDEEND